MGKVEERRRHARVPIEARMHCRRLGLRGFDEDVTACDLSLGGAHLVADRRLGVGDVVVLDVDVDDVALSVRGLVVSVRPVDGNVAEARHVHVAFTGLSPDRLARLGDLVASTSSATG
jgi:hypothetical protein